MPVYDCGDPDCMTCEDAFRRPPFKEGDVVQVKGNEHLGLQRVEIVEWITETAPGIAPYWRCDCTTIREPVDWSKIPEGATGIIVSGGWSGSADSLELADR